MSACKLTEEDLVSFETTLRLGVKGYVLITKHYSLRGDTRLIHIMKPRDSFYTLCNDLARNAKTPRGGFGSEKEWTDDAPADAGWCQSCLVLAYLKVHKLPGREMQMASRLAGKR